MAVFRGNCCHYCICPVSRYGTAGGVSYPILSKLEVAMSNNVLPEFYRLVRDMRAKQKDYFRWRQSAQKASYLSASKGAEAKVDAAMVELSKLHPDAPSAQQKSLFDSNFKPGTL